MSKEDVKQILQKIKNDCTERRICKGCPFVVDGSIDNACVFQRMPDEWRLDEIDLVEADNEVKKND